MGDQKSLQTQFFKELLVQPKNFLLAKKEEMASEAQAPDEDYGVRAGLPFDGRFPYQDQSKQCLMNYIDYHRCHKKYGEDYQACDYFKKFYRTSCPEKWVDKWNDEIEAGTFVLKF